MKTSFTSGQLTALDKLIKAKGKDHEALQTLLANGALADLIEADPTQINREFLRRTLGLSPLKVDFVVDYSMSLEEMIEDAHFNDVHDYYFITAGPDGGFTVKGKGKVRFKPELFNFDSIDSYEEVTKHMEDRDCRPAKLEELIAYDKVMGQTNRGFNLVGLGTVGIHCSDPNDKSAPCIHWTGENDDCRELDLHDLSTPGRGLVHLIKFLGVRK